MLAFRLPASLTFATHIFWTALPVIPINISSEFSTLDDDELIPFLTNATSLNGMLTPGPSPKIVFFNAPVTSELKVKKSKINLGSLTTNPLSVVPATSPDPTYIAFSATPLQFQSISIIIFPKIEFVSNWAPSNIPNKSPNLILASISL